MTSTQPDYSPIFHSIKIGNVEIKNRIAMSPMNTNYTEGGRPTRQQMAFYAARARGGTGLIMIEAVGATKAEWANTYAKYDNLNIFEGLSIRGLADLAEHIHAYGAKVFMQLAVSAGRQGSSEGGTSPQPHSASPIPYVVQPGKLPRGMDPRAIFRALGYHGKMPTSLEELEALSQEVPGTHMRGEMPREITVDEIKELVRDIGEGAKNAKIAGFDGVEIHAPHGYLIHSFFSSRSNTRTDEYGGPFENRIRMLVECIRSIRAKVGPDYAVGVRISASEDLPNGFDPHYAARIAKRCQDEGVDFIHLSDGSYEAMNDFLPDKDGQVIEKAAIIKKALEIPLICPSVHSPKSVAKVLSSGKADMISQGRQQIADPDWVNKVLGGRPQDIIRCTRCNKGCIGRFMLGLPTRCDENPATGMEEFMDEYVKRPNSPIRTRVWQTLEEIGAEPSRIDEEVT